MNPIVLIPARLAATRLPEKPLADINGEPMIVHVWRRGVAAELGPVIVACDDARIKAAIEKAGGKAVMTRADHPSGSDRIFEALGIIDAQKHHDVIINVQGDVPTIDPESIRAVLMPLENPQVDIATLACEIIEKAERADPAVVKPVLSLIAPRIARALYFSRASIPAGDGPLYHHIGIYAYRRAALERFVSLPPSPLELREKLEQLRALEAGMRIDAALVNTVPLGVDTKEHLERARKMLSAK
jgi:3-deoxy-manno-octulosonate cytidylyltransferase (CMP-KDO synthetase)